MDESRFQVIMPDQDLPKDYKVDTQKLTSELILWMQENGISQSNVFKAIEALRLIQDAYTFNGEPCFPLDSINQLKSLIIAIHENTNLICCIIDKQCEEIVAVGSVIPLDNGIAELGRMVVAQKRRGLGLSRIISQKRLEIASKLNLNRFFLRTRGPSESVLSLWKDLPICHIGFYYDVAGLEPTVNKLHLYTPRSTDICFTTKGLQGSCDLIANQFNCMKLVKKQINPISFYGAKQIGSALEIRAQNIESYNALCNNDHEGLYTEVHVDASTSQGVGLQEHLLGSGYVFTGFIPSMLNNNTGEMILPSRIVFGKLKEGICLFKTVRGLNLSYGNSINNLFREKIFEDGLIASCDCVDYEDPFSQHLVSSNVNQTTQVV